MWQFSDSFLINKWTSHKASLLFISLPYDKLPWDVSSYNIELWAFCFLFSCKSVHNWLTKAARNVRRGQFIKKMCFWNMQKCIYWQELTFCFQNEYAQLYMNDNHDQSNELVEYNASINTHIQLLRNKMHQLYREHEFKVPRG